MDVIIYIRIEVVLEDTTSILLLCGDLYNKLIMLFTERGIIM